MSPAIRDKAILPDRLAGRCRLWHSRGMTKADSRPARAQKVLAALRARYPRPETHLNSHNAWELLVATVLAAQCTDARVNTITPELFRRWPGPAELAGATQEELEEVIRSAGFYHSKAKICWARPGACGTTLSAGCPKPWNIW